MSTKARKERKRAAIKFEKPAKVGTPIRDRSWFTALVSGAPKTRHDGTMRPRSETKVAQALTSGPVRSAHDTKGTKA